MQCPHCGFKFRLNVISDRCTKTRYLRSGCCDSPLRPCPSPIELLRCPNLTSDERDYLQRVASLEWFGGAVASVLLQLEEKAGVAA